MGGEPKIWYCSRFLMILVIAADFRVDHSVNIDSGGNEYQMTGERLLACKCTNNNGIGANLNRNYTDKIN